MGPIIPVTAAALIAIGYFLFGGKSEDSSKKLADDAPPDDQDPSQGTVPKTGVQGTSNNARSIAASMRTKTPVKSGAKVSLRRHGAAPIVPPKPTRKLVKLDPTPHPQPGPQPEPQPPKPEPTTLYARVTTKETPPLGDLKIREAPGINGKQIGGAAKDSLVEVLEWEAKTVDGYHWAYIKAIDKAVNWPATTGYAAQAFLKPIGGWE